MATVGLESKTFEKFADVVGHDDDLNYLNHDHSVLSWLFTLDHKRIGFAVPCNYNPDVSFGWCVGRCDPLGVVDS